MEEAMHAPPIHHGSDGVRCGGVIPQMFVTEQRLHMGVDRHDTNHVAPDPRWWRGWCAVGVSDAIGTIGIDSGNIGAAPIGGSRSPRL
jgi:hypothetical protein